MFAAAGATVNVGATRTAAIVVTGLPLARSLLQGEFFFHVSSQLDNFKYLDNRNIDTLIHASYLTLNK